MSKNVNNIDRGSPVTNDDQLSLLMHSSDPNEINNNNLISEESNNEQQSSSICSVIKEEIVQLKWRALLIMCLMTFGQYYINDFPGAIGTGKTDTIQSKFVADGQTYNQEMNQILYSVYSYPNVILAMVGGLLIDNYLGVRRASLLFIVCIMLGSLLFYIGVKSVNYPLMVASRFIYGLGGESLGVAQSTYVARYFSHGRGMALAFAITISCSRIGSSFTFMFSPRIAGAWGVDYACLVGVFVCVLSFVSVVGIILVDIYAEKKGYVAPVMNVKTERFHPRDILKFSPEIWIICGICVFCYCSIFPFSGIAKNFFEVKYGMTADTATLYMSFYMYSSTVSGPIVGILADRVGRYPIWCLLAGCGFILFHVLVLTTMTPAYIITIGLGICLSLLASGLWASVPYCVEPSVLGLCYGILNSLQNAGLATWPIINGAILDIYTPKSSSGGNTTTTMVTGDASRVDDDDDNTPLPELRGFRYVEIFLIATAAVSVSLSVVLIIVDKAHGTVLMASPADREEKLKRQRTERKALLSSSALEDGDKSIDNNDVANADNCEVIGK